MSVEAGWAALGAELDARDRHDERTPTVWAMDQSSPNLQAYRKRIAARPAFAKILAMR